VHFAGYLSGNALAGFYRCCDALVVPSLYEPFGIVALEGMVNRAPVIASDAGGLGEIVQHNQNGLQFPAGDAQALTQQLMRVLSDAAMARDIAEEGYRHALAHYDWGDIAAQTIDCYRPHERLAAE